METADKLLELFIKNRPAYDDVERRDCQHSSWLLRKEEDGCKDWYPFFVQCADNC